VSGFRPFDLAEIREIEDDGTSTTDLADVLAVARDLEALAAVGTAPPTVDFADRVMGAVALEPAPKLVVRPGATVRGGRFGAFLIAVRDSWAVAMSGGRPLAVRAQALAFVLLVVLAAGALTGVTAVTVGGFLSAGPGPTPSTDVLPTVEPTPSTTPTPSPTPTGEPTDSAEPEDSGERETAEPSRPREPIATAKPELTPRPTRTPEGTEKPSPKPDPTEDDGGEGES
jgi:hypothetical protein